VIELQGAVEAVPAPHLIQLLSDNGGSYLVAHEPKHIARSLDLTPVNTPVCKVQSYGVAESFVNTLKRDHVSRMYRRKTRLLLVQLPAAFEHLYEAHPHSSSTMESLREFRQQPVKH
jgi:putative transposase